MGPVVSGTVYLTLDTCIVRINDSEPGFSMTARAEISTLNKTHPRRTRGEYLTVTLWEQGSPARLNPWPRTVLHLVALFVVGAHRGNRSVPP